MPYFRYRNASLPSSVTISSSQSLMFLMCWWNKDQEETQACMPSFICHLVVSLTILGLHQCDALSSGQCYIIILSWHDLLLHRYLIRSPISKKINGLSVTISKGNLKCFQYVCSSPNLGSQWRNREKLRC